MKNFTSNFKVRYLVIAFTITVILIFGGCYFIQTVDQPEKADPQTPFNVSVFFKTDNGYEPSDFVPAYGYIGILLPEGWKVKDSVYYIITTNPIKSGVFISNTSVALFIKSKKGIPPAGYYWWGAMSKYPINLNYNETGSVNITIIPDKKEGSFKLKYVFGDDTDWNKQFLGDVFGIVTESDYMPIKVLSLHSNKNRIINEFNVYPNPATEQVTFSWSSNYEQLNLKVYQITGKYLIDKIISPNEETDVSHLPKGIYLYRLSHESEIIKTGKLVIE